MKRKAAADDISKDNLLRKIHFIMERVIVFDGIDEVLEHVVKTAVSLARAEAATLRVFNIVTGKLEIKSGFGLSKRFLTQPPLNLGEGIVGKVVLHGKPFMTTNVSKERHCVYKELAELEGIKALLSVPLKTSSKTIGCITVYRKTDEAYADTDLLLLNIFAAQAVEAVEKTKLLEDLKNQATFDQLTNVYNKTSLIRRLEEEIKRASRHNHPLSILFVDIDDFKEFNDTHGHLLGDKLLADFVSLQKALLRKNDIIGRYGGEEFIIATPENDKKKTLALANKLLDAVNHHGFLGKKKDAVGISFSAGISSFPEDGKTALEIINKADQALYRAKREGKNRIKVWEKG